MQERKVILTWEAIYDIADAEIWIYDNFGESQQFKYRNRIKQELEQLQYQADILAKTDLEYRGYQIYKRPFSPAIIFYVIIEDVVHVLRILREEENWSLYFRNNENYEYTYPE